LPPSPPKRHKPQDDDDFDEPPQQPSSSSVGPLLPISSPDSNLPASSSSSNTHHHTSHPVSQKDSKKVSFDDDDDDDEAQQPEHFRLDKDDDEDSDSDRTVDYGDLVKDLYVDEDEWSLLSTDHKLCSMTGPFTIPRDAYGNPVDVSTTYTTQKTLRNLKDTYAFQYKTSKASKADLVEDYSLLTDEDEGIIHLCFEASGLVIKDSA
jgi:hypothetical protein